METLSAGSMEIALSESPAQYEPPLINGAEGVGRGRPASEGEVDTEIEIENGGGSGSEVKSDGEEETKDQKEAEEQESEGESDEGAFSDGDDACLERLTRDPELEEKNEELRIEAAKVLSSIEVDFARFKETRFEEQMAVLQKEVALFETGEYLPYKHVETQIQQKAHDRVSRAKARFKYSLGVAEKLAQGNRYAIACEIDVRKGDVRRKLCQDVAAKKRKLVFDKANLDSRPYYRDEYFSKASISRRQRTHHMELKDIRSLIRDGYFPSSKLPSTTSEDIEADLNIIRLHRKVSPGKRRKASAAGSSTPRETSLTPTQDEVMTEAKDEGIIFGHAVFTKGDKVLVIDEAKGEYVGNIVAHGTAEVTIQRSDGSKTRISTDKIHKGAVRFIHTNK